ncbi:MAG: 50S ribosomal protein L11 methyltransferase [Ruminococcaceae bacterium]|nr:50S ribosomal protein L11 methyltransferase [Oscillospiraceae bacterium]
MQWLELTIQTTNVGIELIGSRLTALGFDSFIIDDEADFRQFLEENRKYWDYVDEQLDEAMRGLCQIRLYLEDGPDAPGSVKTLRAELDALAEAFPMMGTPVLRIDNQRDEDWENNWKQYYSPLPIGEKLLVVPQWLSPENPEGRIPVILDPGLTFGTGAHASTRMCMQALEKAIVGGEMVVDLGSGSGILSIAALRLGAKHAVGVDIDEKAEDVARENAAYNDLHADRFTAMTGNVLEDEGPIAALCPDGYDVVLANIVADVIIPLAPHVGALGKKGGTFICSGILSSRLAEVEAALAEAGLTITDRYRSDDDWCCLRADI